jgi:endoglucanase
MLKKIMAIACVALILGVSGSATAVRRLRPSMRINNPKKVLKIRQPRRARNLATVQQIRGFNLSYFEIPTFQDNLTRVRQVFDAYAAAGFNAVRLPIKWDDDTAQTAPYTIDPTLTFSKLDPILAEARKRGFAIVINVHHYDALMVNPQGEESRYLAIWRQIAQRYDMQPGDLYFELLNEPKGEFNNNPELWNTLIPKVVSTIRSSNPTRLLIVGPVRWNNINHLKFLRLPNDANLTVTFHFYDPFDFTHQGASWVNPVPPIGTSWTGTASQKAEIDKKLDQAVTWATTNSRPLFMGEFGTYNKAKLNDRALWTEYVRKAAVARNIGWSYWESDKGFGAYNYSTKQWIDPLRSALAK